MCVLMTLAIDSVVRGCHTYKDFRSDGIDCELLHSPKSAIAKTGMLLHLHTLIQ